MSDYRRSTTASTWDALPAPIREHILAYEERHQIGSIHTDLTACILTTNERIKKPLIGGDPDKVHTVAAMFSERWFIFARHGEKGGKAALAARLHDLEVKDYAYATMVPDHGLDVLAMWVGASERGSIFLGLSDDRAGNDFAAALKAAVEAAKT